MLQSRSAALLEGSGVDLFSFDSSRLEFAKFAYGHTVDRNRYFQTYNSFTFDSSVNELSEFIARS